MRYNDEPIVDILMATYNGGVYISEQIQSILDQQYLNWRLLVHDDGSTDGTLDIVNSYQIIDSRIQLIDDGISGLGPARNFLHLLSQSKAAYIAFADQDDWWSPDRLSRQMHFIQSKEQEGPSHPIAVYCNALYWVDGRVKKDMVNMLHPGSLAQHLFLNGGIIGCSILFNRALFDSLYPLPSKVAMHDHFVVTAALTWGQLYHQNEPLIHYRQHEKNVTGIQERVLKKKLKGLFFSNRTLVDRKHYQAHRAFYEQNAPRLDQEANKLFLAYFEIVAEKKCLKRLSLIKENGFQLAHKKYVLYLKTILRKTIDS